MAFKGIYIMIHRMQGIQNHHDLDKLRETTQVPTDTI